MPDIMSQGFNLAFLGMGTVFFFLTLLVGVTMVMSLLVSQLTPSEEVLIASEAVEVKVDSRIHAVIAAAVSLYRKKNQRH